MVVVVVLDLTTHVVCFLTWKAGHQQSTAVLLALAPARVQDAILVAPFPAADRLPFPGVSLGQEVAYQGVFLFQREL